MGLHSLCEQQQQELQRAQGAKMGRAHCLQKEERETEKTPESNAPAQILTESGKGRIGKKGFPFVMNETCGDWKNRDLLEYLMQC